jgi:hypothetical protein
LQESFDVGHDLSREQEFVGAGVLVALSLDDYVTRSETDPIRNRLFVTAVEQA